MRCRAAAAPRITNESPPNTSAPSFDNLDSNRAATLTAPATKATSSAFQSTQASIRRPSRAQPGEVIMLSAHLDHLGVNESLTGDKIFNGADDDASGCVAVLELARVLAAGKRPRRTIYFICFGSEERGGQGSRYFIANSPVPLPQIVAD